MRVWIYCIRARALAPRQQTLRALMDWSYDLLPQAERRVFENVSVFAGGWTAEAVASVCAEESLSRRDEIQILDTLARLADKSLVLVLEQGARFDMLETVRAYAVEKLRAAGRADEIAARHFVYFNAFAERTAPLIVTAQQRAALDALEREHDNLRAALHWSRDNAPIAAHAQLTVTLAEFWRRRGHLHEGRVWLHEALTRLDDSKSATLCGAITARAGLFTALLGDYENGARLKERAVFLLREANALPELTRALYSLAVTQRELGCFDAAEENARAAVAIAERVGNADELAEALSVLGTIHYNRGDAAVARQYFLAQLEAAQRGTDGEILAVALINATSYRNEFEKSLQHLDRAQRIADKLDNRYLQMVLYRHRGLAYTTRPNDAVSLENFRAGLKLAARLGAWRLMIKLLEDIAVLYPRNGHVPQAASILGFTAQLRAQHSLPLIPIEQQKQAAARQDGLETMEETEWHARCTDGGALGLNDVLSIALDEKYGARNVSAEIV